MHGYVQCLPDVTSVGLMLYMPSLPDIINDTGQKNVGKLSNCDDIKQYNEQDLLFYCHPLF